MLIERFLSPCHSVTSPLKRGFFSLHPPTSTALCQRIVLFLLLHIPLKKGELKGDLKKVLLQFESSIDIFNCIKFAEVDLFY